MTGWLFLLSTLLFFVAPSGKQKTLSPEIKAVIRPCRQTLKKCCMASSERAMCRHAAPSTGENQTCCTRIYYELGYPFKNNRVGGTIAFLFKSYPYHIQSLKQKCVSENTWTPLTWRQRTRHRSWSRSRRGQQRSGLLMRNFPAAAQRRSGERENEAN